MNTDQFKDLKDKAKGIMENATPEQKRDLMKGMQSAGQKWLTNEEFAKHYEFGKKIGQDRGDNEIMLQFWMMGKAYSDSDEKEKDVIMPVMFGDWPPEGMTKQEALQAIGVMFAEEYPNYMLQTVVHVAEAWMVNRPKDSDVSGVVPSEADDRIEIVTVTALSLDYRFSNWLAEIERDKDGKFAGLKTRVEKIHDPANPVLPGEMHNYLAAAIFQGYGIAREGKKIQKEMKMKVEKIDLDKEDKSAKN